LDQATYQQLTSQEFSDKIAQRPFGTLVSLKEELRQLLDIEFFTDGTTTCHVKPEGSKDMEYTQSAASIHRLKDKLSLMFKTALRLESHGQLTKNDLQLICESFEVMNPLLKLKVLTQDLALYKEIHRLNHKLLNSEARSAFQQYDWESVAIDTNALD
jgi:hypothetical protein